MKWMLVPLGVLVFMFFVVGVTTGIHSQAFSRWWFAGSTLNAPGVVPIVAPPQGPLLGDSSDLMRVIQPWMGVPYLFGGATLRGVDCSAFVQITARDVGLSLPRTAQAQYNATERVSTPAFGDLVFFQATYSSPDRVTHVGWYVADGMMISAAEPSVGRQSLATPFWRAHFFAFGRIRR